jgi:hypothetical protein
MNQIKQVNADGIQVMNVCRFANSVIDPCKTSPSGKAAQIRRASHHRWLGSRRLSPAAVVRWC